MAVARIKAEPTWFREAAAVLGDVPRAERELMAARLRPGRTAELTAAEVRLLAERLPDWLTWKALVDIEVAEEYEQQRAATQWRPDPR
jgi:hypothetical protein